MRRNSVTTQVFRRPRSRRSLGSALAVAAAASVLAACSSGAASPGSTGSTTSGAVSDSGSTDGAIGPVAYVSANNDIYFGTIGCGAKKQATAQNVSFSQAAPSSYDPSVQIPVLNSVIAKKPKLIIIASTDQSALLPPLLSAKQQGIKIIEVEDATNDADSIAESVIQLDNAAGGRMAADALAKQLGGKGSVLPLDLQPGDITTNTRTKGFEDEIKAKYPGITILPTQYYSNDLQKAATIVSSTLAAHPGLSAVFSANTFGTEGAATAVQQAGKAGKVKVVGFDAEPKEVTDLKQNSVQALIAGNALTEGQDSIEQAVNVLSGKPTTKNITLPFILMTQSNISDPGVSKYVYNSSC